MSYLKKVTQKVRIECWSAMESTNDPFVAPELKNIRLRGRVFGHPVKKDGDLVKTSYIQGVNGKLVYTMNTVYELGEVDPEFLKWMKMMGIEFNSDEPIKMK